MTTVTVATPFALRAYSPAMRIGILARYMGGAAWFDDVADAARTATDGDQVREQL